MRLIDADELKTAFPASENSTPVLIASVRATINHMPTIEQPEIIHCRDCKYWMPYDWMFSEVWKSKNMEDYLENEIGCVYADMSMSATDFCSRAERREDDHEAD